jgi:hypothetical protein
MCICDAWVANIVKMKDQCLAVNLIEELAQRFPQQIIHEW